MELENCCLCGVSLLGEKFSADPVAEGDCCGLCHDNIVMGAKFKKYLPEVYENWQDLRQEIDKNENRSAQMDLARLASQLKASFLSFDREDKVNQFIDEKICQAKRIADALLKLNDAPDLPAEDVFLKFDDVVCRMEKLRHFRRTALQMFAIAHAFDNEVRELFGSEYEYIDRMSWKRKTKTQSKSQSSN